MTTHQQLKGDLLMKRTALAEIHELDTALPRYWTPDHVSDFRQTRGLWLALPFTHKSHWT